jgi:threonine/homoserine/homoserine lactone efflux protein
MVDPTPLTYLLQGAALGFTAAISPGPFQTYLITETLSGGWRRGLPVTFAPLLTDLPIILLSLFLLNRLPEYFLRFISLAGGIFVLYLAYRIWSKWRKGTELNEADTENPKGSLRRGAIANLLTPGPYLFWALVNGPILLSALRQSIAAGAAFLIGFYGVMVLSLIGIVVIFHQARRLGPRVVHILLLISIVVLIIFGLILFRQGILG